MKKKLLVLIAALYFPYIFLRFINGNTQLPAIIIALVLALNLMVWIFLSGIFLLTPGGIIIDFILIIPIALGFTYAALLATSAYSIVLLSALYKNGILTHKQFILHCIFQLIFLTDVIDQLVIQKFTRIKEQPVCDMPAADGEIRERDSY